MVTRTSSIQTRNTGDQAGLPLLVAYYRRCLPSFLHVKNLVDEAQIGDVRLVRGITANQAGLYPAEDTVSASWRHESGVLGVGSWCFAASPESQVEETEIIGSRGRIRFSFFGEPRVEVETGEGVKSARFENPRHIQQPLIETVVNHLLGYGECPSTGVSAARTTEVLEAIVERRALFPTV